MSVAGQLNKLPPEETYKNPFSLVITSLSEVFCHESVDADRVTALAARLEKDGVLINPPLVMAIDKRYVVLDGATRIAALRQLQYPQAVVQVISDRARLRLDTWFHAIRQATPPALVDLLATLPDLAIVENTGQNSVSDRPVASDLCTIRLVTGRVFHIQPAPGVNRLTALNKLTATYIDAYQVARTLNNDIKRLHQEYPDLTALVIFPEYSLDKILQIARTGHVLPAGITRFVIPGRVLRIHVDLSLLKAAKPLSEKNAWLDRFILTKINEGRLRYYEEPVYLLDE